MVDSLIATFLKEPVLRFDYTNRRAISPRAYDGLRQYGPYDAELRRREGIRPVPAVIVGRADRPNAIADVSDALIAKRLNKLHDVFNLEIAATIKVPPTSIEQEARAYRDAIEDWFEATPYMREVEIAVVLHGDEIQYRRSSPYYAAKAAFMRRGVPTQSIRYENVARGRQLDDFNKYYVANILIACYAKIGGQPWVVQASSPWRPEVTIGVARTAVFSGDDIERFVGISTIFKENGAFALWDITKPEQDWDKYQTQLENGIVRAIETFEQRENRQVTRIACHVSGKRAGFRERDAIAAALKRFPQREIAADVVHITDDASLWLLDGSDASLLPKSGLLTNLALDGSTALLHTEGRGARASFLTRPLKLALYGETNTNPQYIYQHLYGLRWMSWRGVRASNGPVSVVYPKKMAYLLAYLHEQEDIVALDILPKLKNKAWFL